MAVAHLQGVINATDVKMVAPSQEKITLAFEVQMCKTADENKGQLLLNWALFAHTVTCPVN